MTDKAIEIQPDTANIKITVDEDGADGVWLHFTTHKGLHAMLNVGVLADKHERRDGSIIYSAINQWCNERAEQATSIKSLERK